MNLSSTIVRRLVAGLALVAAIAAVTAPVAQTAPDAVDRYLHNRAQPTTADPCDLVCRYLRNHDAQPGVVDGRSPDTVDASDAVSRYLRNHMQRPITLDGRSPDTLDAARAARANNA
jgi:hypothetical protein